MMSFTTALFSRYVGPNIDQRLSDSDWQIVDTSLNLLVNNSLIATFFSGLSANPGTISIRRSPDADQNAFWGETDKAISFTDTIYSGFETKNPAGNTFRIDLTRTIFHELVHAKYHDTDNLVSDKVAYQREERNVFLENTVYRSAFGGDERVGHGTVALPSASAVRYLDGMTLVEPGTANVFKFTFGTTEITKNYNDYGVSVSASVNYQYDHYISIVLKSDSRLLFENGTIDNQKLFDVFAGVQAADPTTALASAGKAILSVQTLRADLADGLANTSAGSDLLNSLRFFTLDQTAFQGVSAEAFADSYNGGPYLTYYGAASINTTTVPDVLAIDATQVFGAILVGGSGYNKNGINALDTADDLKAGSGNDLLLAGNSRGTRVNLLDGGAGRDILIGGTGRDQLTGGDGDDLMLGGSGGDVFKGGAGNDVVSYTTATTGVSVDLSLRSGAADFSTVVGLTIAGAVSDATDDKMGDVEILIGSSHDDILKGDGTGVTLFGGDGDDQITGKMTDLLVGGAGNDILHHEDGDGTLSGGEGDDELYGGAGTNYLEGDDGADKLVSEGVQDTISGGKGNDLIELKSESAILSYSSGDGDDVVQTKDGDYQLSLTDLNKNDIELVAAGTDFIDTTGHIIPFQADLNVLIIRVKSTGEQISFIKQSNVDNMFDGYRARDGVVLSTNTATFGDTIDEDGPYKYELNADSVANSPLNSIQFADGTIWSAETIWSKIADYENNSDVSFDVLQPSGPGLRGGLLPSSGHASARMAASTLLVSEQSGTAMDSSGFSDPIDYIDHLNNSYFGGVPLPYPAGQDIEGTSWSEGLSDGYGSDTLNGAQGDDWYRPTFGDDRMLWNVGDGNDVVEESTGSHFGNDTLVLGEGIAPSDIRIAATDDGAGLIISFADIEGSITLSNQVGALDGRGALSISFNDGTIWTHEDILAAASDVIASAHQSVVGTPGDDNLLGEGYQDLVTNFTAQGGEGDDVIGVSGDGGGEIIFAKGDGHDMLLPDLTKYYLNDVRSDILSLTDILPSEVTFKRAGDALVITVTSTGDAFIAQSQFTTESPDAGEGVNQIAFGDGTIWTRSDILAAVSGSDGNDSVVGGSNADWLFGGDYDDVLAGGLGNDLLDGGAGDDTYRFGIGDGQDVIRENNLFGNGGDDTIELGIGIATGDMTVSEEDDGQDLVLRITGTDDQITIDNAISDPDARIETVSFADGSSWSFADLMVQATLPTAGDDTFYGSELSETLSGGAGNDTLIGGGGDDIYRFGHDDGYDTIRDFSSGGASDNDTIEFSADVDARYVTVAQANDGSDLVLNAGNTHVTIMNAIDEGEARIEQVLFADGTVWNFADMMARSTVPTAANDKFYGSELADTLSGGAGNDTLIGRDGSDVLIGGVGNDKLNGGSDGDIYRFAPGDGQDTIQEGGFGAYGNTEAEDAIEFSAGIAPDDVIVSEANNGQDLVLQIAGTNDRVTISSGITGPYGGNYSQIENVRFADGTTWSFADLMARATVSTAGDDTIYGSDLSDTLSGGAGNDTLVGREGDDVLAGGTGNDTLDGGRWGNDTYQFARGDGQDVIVEGYDDDNDVLEFARGITTDDVTVSEINDGQDLVFQIAGTDDRVTIGGMNAASWATNIETVRFADGTVWSFADVMARATAPTGGNDVTYGSYLSETLSGGAGDDVLFGRDGDDVIVGGAGNDRLSGDVGNDIYRFAPGDGQDVIEENSDIWGDGGDNDVLEFASGIAPEDVIITQSADGQSLILSINGTNDSIELLNSITDEDDRVEQVRFYDGTVWSYSDMVGGGGELSLGTPMADASAYRGDAIDIAIPASAFTVPTGDTISYSATLVDGSALPSWLTLDGDHFVGTVPATAIGVLDIKLTASDGSTSVSDTFGLSIGIDTNPAITMGEWEQITEGNDRILADENPNTSVNALGGDDYITLDAWNDGVSAGDGNDVIEMFGDNEWASGDAGSDVFIFDSNAFLPSAPWITDWAAVEDFTPGTDRVGIMNNTGGVSSFAQLQPFMAQSGSDVVINLTGLPTITLAGVDLSSLDASDFMFGSWPSLGTVGTPPAAGTVPYPTIDNTTALDHLNTTDGNDRVLGNGVNNTTVQMYSGDDYITTDGWGVVAYGGRGNDIFEINGTRNYVCGGPGYDYFIFDGANIDPSYLNDSYWAEIYGFQDGVDKIVIRNGTGGVTDFDDLSQYITQDSDGAVLALPGVPVIGIDNIDPSQLDASDFIFESTSQSEAQSQGQAQSEQLVSVQPVTASESSEAASRPDHKSPAWRNMMGHAPKAMLVPNVQAWAEQMTQASAMFGAVGSPDDIVLKAPRHTLATIGHLSIPSPTLHPYQ